MGYSCRQDADTTYREWSDYCYATTGVSNSYRYKNNRYCLQVGREQRDGAITGTVMLLIDNPDIAGQYLAYNKGSFRINPDGVVTRFPTGLNDLLAGAAA
jgi:hypothetical protein